MTSDVRPLRGAALAAIVTLAVQALIGLATAGMAARSFALDRTRPEDLDALIGLYDQVMIVLAVPSVLGYLAAATAVILWLWRARANAEFIDSSPQVDAGAHQRWGRPWVIAGWLVPLAHFFVPRQVVGDVWSASVRGRGMGLVNAWWALWILFMVCGIVTQFKQYETATDALFTHMRFVVLQSLLGVAAAILAIQVVRTLTRAQQSLTAEMTRLASGKAATT